MLLLLIECSNNNYKIYIGKFAICSKAPEKCVSIHCIIIIIIIIFFFLIEIENRESFLLTINNVEKKFVSKF